MLSVGIAVLLFTSKDIPQGGPAQWGWIRSPRRSRTAKASRIYGGAYAYGKTAAGTSYDAAGVSVKIRRKPRADWLALMPNAHEGYVSWEKAETIRKMVSSNVPTSRHHGAPETTLA